MIGTLLDILIHLIYPLNLALLLGFVGLVLRWRQRRRLGAAMIVVGLAILLGFSMPITSSILVRSLEWQYLAEPIEQVPEADAIVVLGGGVETAHPPRQHPQLNAAGNRDFHGAQLFEAGKAPWVIVSGHPDVGTSVLEQMGVPRDSILPDHQSRNTRENATYALQIMQEQGDIERVLLVTSALHMPRALATFERAGIDAIAAPTDYRVLKPSEEERPFYHQIGRIIPRAGSLNGSTRALHEYMGIAYYRLRGWL